MSSIAEPGHDLLIMRDGAAGEARSAMGHTDWHAQDERRFLQKLADRLNAAVRAGEANR